MDWTTSAKVPLRTIIQNIQQGTHTMTLQKEKKSWIRDPLAMAKCDLFVKTKNHSVKIKHKYQTGLYKTLAKQILAEPGKTYMFIRATWGEEFLQSALVSGG